MYDIAFEKAKGRAGKENRTTVYAEAAVRSVLEKRIYEKFRRIYKKSICAGISFLIKSNFVGLQLH